MSCPEIQRLRAECSRAYEAAKDIAFREEQLLKHNARLREALEKIAKTKYLGGTVPNEINEIARSALLEKAR